jgi:signal transduction histidine kinase
VEDVTEFMRMKQAGAEQSKLTEELKERVQKTEMEVFQRAQEVQEANKKLRELDKLKTEFFSNVSHELRTPLTLILAPLESLLASKDTPRAEKETLRMAHNNAVRLLQMVNGLLDFSKLAAEKMKVERETVQISDLTRSLFWDFKPLMSQKAVRGELSVNISEPYVEMDRYMYERILFNLISNAIKFTPQGGKVSLMAEWEAGNLHLAVTDTGIGISEGDQKNLFQRFHQAETSSTRRFEGTGLGLAMVKEFAALLGGSVSVHSRGGEGSRFTVILSAPKSSNKPKVLAEAQRTKPVSAADFTPPESIDEPLSQAQGDAELPKVLVAEDNPELALFISRLLSPFSRVETVPNGKEALERARVWAPDLVLSDVMMPLMDGIELTKEIKGHKETAAIPIVLLTAVTGRDALMRGWEAGADDYLFKPFHPKELEARVKSLLAMVDWREKSRTYRRQRDALEQFTHIASHDLREPLRKISSFANLFVDKHQGQLDGESTGYLEVISRSANHMMQLLDSLMEYSRLDKERPLVEKADLNWILNRVLEGFALDVKETGARITVGDLPALRAVPEQMGTVFRNLIGNSFKYHNEKQPPEIRIGAEQKGGEWVFSVVDNGIGFDPAHAERIFIMFERLHGREKYKGDGMGLAICRKIIENHGGRIWAESEPGKGASFYFTLMGNRG